MKDPRARAALDRGDWAAAAALLEEEGENAEAAALYARLLDFAAAARCQLRAGAPDAALDAAAAGGNRQLEAEVLREVLAISPPAVLERAAAR
ncbi:MAG: hypothetical protein HY904_16980, partial [Deltaproteobacteria bacterium]|nr:hypothetical protein [Deltaproteobacteria bacterium]